MNPAYLEARFRLQAPLPEWPEEFVILSAHATSGQQWSAERNAAADRALGEAVRGQGGWYARLVGYSPSTGHAEPSWAFQAPLNEACSIGLQFEQDAIFHVLGDALSVTYCDDRRMLVPMGSFRARIDQAQANESGGAVPGAPSP